MFFRGICLNDIAIPYRRIGPSPRRDTVKARSQMIEKQEIGEKGSSRTEILEVCALSGAVGVAEKRSYKA